MQIVVLFLRNERAVLPYWAYRKTPPSFEIVLRAHTSILSDGGHAVDEEAAQLKV